MNTQFLSIALTSSVLAICATPATAKDSKYVGNGSYFMFVMPSHLAHVNGSPSSPTAFTSTEADQLQQLDNECHIQLDHKRPSMLKSVGLTAIRNVPGVVAGTAISAMEAFPLVPGIAKTYSIFEAGPALGGSIGAGITGHEYGKHYLQSACMAAAVAEAKKEFPGVLHGILIIPNAFPVNGHRIRRPDGPGTPDIDMGSVTPAQAAAAEKAADDTTPTPLPQ